MEESAIQGLQNGSGLNRYRPMNQRGIESIFCRSLEEIPRKYHNPCANSTRPFPSEIIAGATAGLLITQEISQSTHLEKPIIRPSSTTSKLQALRAPGALNYHFP